MPKPTYNSQAVSVIAMKLAPIDLSRDAGFNNV